MEVGLVFGIIFAAIVISLIAFFGFRYINDMISITCESQTLQQIENLQNAAKSTFALSQGSVQDFKIVLQGNCASRMCFVNPDDSGAYPEGGWAPNEFISTLISKYQYNVIIIKSDGAVEGYKIDKLKQKVNFCLTSGRNVMLRNNGRSVEITLPEF